MSSFSGVDSDKVPAFQRSQSTPNGEWEDQNDIVQIQVTSPLKLLRVIGECWGGVGEGVRRRRGLGCSENDSATKKWTDVGSRLCCIGGRVRWRVGAFLRGRCRYGGPRTTTGLRTSCTSSAWSCRAGTTGLSSEGEACSVLLRILFCAGCRLTVRRALGGLGTGTRSSTPSTPT